MSNETSHAPSFLRRYIFSTDHKVIGIQFLLTSFAMLLLGGLMAALMRWQLGWPGTVGPVLIFLISNGEEARLYSPLRAIGFEGALLYSIL